ncbi:MAG TPA: hypothetical protein VLT36_03170, partial [Candidatus Dormibacteraeota bacterium]|nr:hypothetical protein [Candidatus Dormibacteraeota bacterium]
MRLLLAGWALALFATAACAQDSYHPLTNSWSTRIESFTDSSPALAPDGTIYFGTFHGYLW